MPLLTRYTLTTPEGLSGLPAAASLALTVLQLAQVRRWSDLDGEIPECVVLDDEQFRILSMFQTEVSFLRSTEKKTKDSAGTPGVSMAVCPACGKWLLITSGDAPKKCTLTSGCTGSPQKATAAARTKTTDSVDAPALFDDGPQPEPDQADPVFDLEPEPGPSTAQDEPAEPVLEPERDASSEPVFADCFGVGDF